MKKILKDIQDGTFAKEFLLEAGDLRRAGAASLAPGAHRVGLARGHRRWRRAGHRADDDQYRNLQRSGDDRPDPPL